MKILSSNVMRGSFWPSINFLGGPQLFPKWPHFADFRVWEIQLRRLGRRKGDFSGERPNIARTSNLWPGLIMPKGQVCRTHATPDLIPCPRSTFLRVSAKICQNPIYMPWFGKKFKIKSCFWMPNKLNQHKHSIYLTPDQFTVHPHQFWASQGPSAHSLSIFSCFITARDSNPPNARVHFWASYNA